MPVFERTAICACELLACCVLLALPSPAVSAASSPRALVHRLPAHRPRLTRREMAAAAPIDATGGNRNALRSAAGGPRADGDWVRPYAEGFFPGPYVQSVGRLYVQPPNDRIRFCTATAVAPSVVLTAAHCVMDPSRMRFDDWYVFAPGQRGSSLPHGVWWAQKALVSWYYAGDGGPTHDYAFLVMAPQTRNGGVVRLGDVAGWVPVGATEPSQPVLHLGYPASGLFASECGPTACYAWYCVSAVMPDPGISGAIGIGCDTGFGSSGGPWIQFLGRRGYVTSDTNSGSGGSGSTFSVVWGPVFGEDALALYRLAVASRS